MRLEEIEELRPMTALRLLTTWRECRAEAEEPLERSLLCNARILAESCFSGGKAVFADAEAVLKALTARQMEVLLRRLAGEHAPLKTENPNFDMARFTELEG